MYSRVAALMCLSLLAVVPVNLTAQDLTRSAFGCYDIEIGPWSPALDFGLDSLTLAPPSRVLLDTIPNSLGRGSFNRYYQLRVPSGALPSIHPYSGWIARGDSIRLVWADMSGLAAEVREVPGGLRGEAHSMWDFPRESQTAPIYLRRVSCDVPPPVSVEDQRLIPSAISVINGPRLELHQSFTPTPEWEERSKRVFVLNDVEVEGLGPVRFVEVRVLEGGELWRLAVYLPFGADFEAFKNRLLERHGLPSGVRSPNDKSETRGVTWANRTQKYGLVQARRVDGRWQVSVHLQAWGLW